MAFFRVLWLLHERHPMTPALARKLKRLLLLQTLVFAGCLALYAFNNYLFQSRDIGNYVIGFGLSWVATIRIYVWRFVG